jgi:type III restriction enzyme
MLQLRDYQQRSLDRLTFYLRKVSKQGARSAFVDITGRDYHTISHVEGLKSLPYVCLRVPTGGGKTLMAAHSLSIMAREYLHADRTLCLWLAPSNTIVRQTMDALKDRRHPYREVLDAAFTGNVHIMDLSEALFLTKGALDGATCIIVTTIQSLRVEDTDGRKVYESAGALQHHFHGISESIRKSLEVEGEGTVIFSMANVLRMRRPVVIIDEAHNARTSLSFDTLARFRPSCIIEFTATPAIQHHPESGAYASNILHHVSARELKEAEMIKLPIKLRTVSDWKEVVGLAVGTQRSLERQAEEEQRETGEYIRPIALFQAQSIKGEDISVDVLKQSLIADFKIPEEQIAIATGATREIQGVDLFDPACPIRFIITVRALSEGWDCSFAYVLCSVSEISTPRSVEQILGRILRLPKAVLKKREALNCAYTFAASNDFIQTARSLQDALIEGAGFQRLEAKDLILPHEPSQGKLWGEDSPPVEASAKVYETPDLSRLPDEVMEKVSFSEDSGTLTVRGDITEQDAASLKECFQGDESRQAVDLIFIKISERKKFLATSIKTKPFRIPLLSIRIGGQIELFEESHFLEIPWNIAHCEAGLSEKEFPSVAAVGKAGEIDIRENGRLETRFVEDLQAQMRVFSNEPGWTVGSLADWLDRNIFHPDIPRSQSSLFIHNAISALMASRCIGIEQIAREKFRLLKSLRAKMEEYRIAHRKKGYQTILFGTEADSIEVSPENCLTFDENRYAPGWQYEGGYRFEKHFFRAVGELKNSGEEFECAVFIDQMPQVKSWVRNIERRPDSSFWLQTSTDRFYPDFVTFLDDGRILVVEYKGADRWSNDDSKEKRAVGELWAQRSKGRCLFAMPKGKDWDAICTVLERSQGTLVDQGLKC